MERHEIVFVGECNAQVTVTALVNRSARFELDPFPDDKWCVTVFGGENASFVADLLRLTDHRLKIKVRVLVSKE